MIFRKAFKHALNMVMHAKVRSWLTILGIVIGVAAVIAIVSLGQSLQQEMDTQLGALGGDLITLRAGASRAMGFGPGRDLGGSSSASTEEIVLDKTDLQVLRGIEHIKIMDTQISGRADVYYVAEKGSTTITGVDPATWYQISTTSIGQGRTLGPADVNVIVVGGRFATNFFKTQVGMNQLITIEDRLFRIVGILDDTSTNIYMPIQSAYDILEDKEKDEYDSIIIKVKDESQIDEAIAEIQEKLMLKRHVQANKLDFSISSNKEMQEQRQEMTSSLTTFLTAIAAVALLVGAVGIANTMFTSVLEKTREIGIMKAIGAKNKDILIIFLLNSGLIGLVGGIGGIILGVLGSSLVGYLGSSAATGTAGRLFGTTLITPGLVIFSLLFSLIIGMIAGVIPAYRASKLNPVDALRYE